MITFAFSSATMAANIPLANVQLVGFGDSPHLADLNGDGRTDILTVSYNQYYGNDLLWYENRTTTWTQHILFHSGYEFDAAIPADLDGDGDMDIITSGGVFPNLVWLENDGKPSPSFTSHNLDARSMKMASALDMDADGDLDIVVLIKAAIGVGPAVLRWYENNGQVSPQFTSHTIASLTYYSRGFYPADLNNDGNLDFAVSDNVLGTLWFENNGGHPASFSQHDISLDYGQVKVADVNGDGWRDIMVGFRLFLNKGTQPLSFSSQVLDPGFTASGHYYGFVEKGDLDQDGAVDLLANDPHDMANNDANASNTLYLYHNDGGTSPTFSRQMVAQMIGDYDRIQSYQVGDLDGNGMPDVVLGAGGGVHLIKNLATPKNITVLSPNEGAVWRSGRQAQVAWRTNTAKAGTTVGVEIWKGLTQRVSWIQWSSSASGTGVATFTVPRLATRNDYRVRIYSQKDRQYADFSDEPITLIQNNGVPLNVYRMYE